MAPGKMKDDITAARIDADKRYLRRDVKVTDEYKQQLELRIKELVEWGVEIGDKGKTKLTEAGIIIPGVNDDMVEEGTVSKEEVRIATKEELEGKTVKVVEGGLFAQDAAVDADIQEVNFPKNSTATEE